MIIVNIKNGLGNQMFQYAFGKVLEWKYGVLVYFDLLRDDISIPLQSDLHVFNIDPILEADPKWRKPFLPFSVRQYRDKKQYFKYIYYKFRRKYQKYKLITEPYPSQYMPIFNSIVLDKNYYFLGFWQNPSYFKGYEDRIRKLFEPVEKSVLNDSIAVEIMHSDKDTVSLHFRRGDYLTSGFILPLDMSYYVNAVDIITKKLSNPYFYIFSDEPDWVLKNLKIDYPFSIITDNKGNNAYIDIVLMSMCKNHIIANSSFSWWGAWLGNNPEKIVIAPQKWYGTEKRDKYIKQITPDNWIRI
jgi:hypothetical protein